jgi:hypothetical protein
MRRIVHLKRGARRLTDDQLALMREYDIMHGGTHQGERRRRQIRRALRAMGIRHTARPNCYGAAEHYWDLGGGYLMPTTTEGWRQNRTYCARCLRQRDVPHSHWWGFFWVCEYLADE